MMPEKLIEQIRPYYEAQDPGHDWAHIQRVVKTAARLARAERADLAIVVPAAYLHDIVNVPKNHPERLRASELAAEKAVKLLREHGYDETKLAGIQQAVVEHSFSRGLTPSSIESACVQDADRLDAIGAIGVLRCAAVSLEMKGSFYDPQDPWAKERPRDDKKWMVDHYFEKLFKLAGSMQTKEGRAEGARRTEFMRQFLGQLSEEI